MPLAEVARLLSRAACLIGVHGAGWANLIFMGHGAHAIEMALPEPHAIYAAYAAYALGLHYHLVPLRGVALHSATYIEAPVERVGAALRRALRKVVRHDAEVAAADETSTGAAPDEATPLTVPYRSAVEASVGMAALRNAPLSRASSVEVVVARYREDASWASAYNATVYSKSDDVPEWGHRIARWRRLPNVGRESHTILHHLSDRYDTLADWTVFMQGDPFDHMPPGIDVDTYVNASTSGRATFFPLTAVTLVPYFRGLAFRTGYAPYPPLSGELVGAPGAWARQNTARLPLMLQPLGLWSGEGEYSLPSHGRHAGHADAFVNQSVIAVPLRAVDAGLRVLQQPLHWIDDRQKAQGDPGIVAFWRRFAAGELGSEHPPSRLYHVQGAQFALSAEAIRRRPKAWYRAMLEELSQRGPDPVASYYCELLWWYLLDEDGTKVALQW